MLKLGLSFALTLVLAINCSSPNLGQKDATTVGDGGWAGEGWGGPPEQRSDGKSPKDTKPRDWYYMKYRAAASEKAIASKKAAMMQSTCKEAARVQGAADVIRKMVGETIEGASGVSDGQSTGQVLVSQLNGNVRGVGVYECKAIGPGSDPRDVSKDNWEQCECVIYTKYDGGRESLIGKAQAVDKAQ